MNDYRIKEGSETKKDLLLKISSINSILAEVEKIENLRIDRKRKKLQNEFDKLNIEFDKSRLEQEMIYYIEKFDVNDLGAMALHHHTDPGILTLLLQDMTGGLQAKSKEFGGPNRADDQEIRNGMIICIA